MCQDKDRTCVSDYKSQYHTAQSDPFMLPAPWGPGSLWSKDPWEGLLLAQDKPGVCGSWIPSLISPACLCSSRSLSDLAIFCGLAFPVFFLLPLSRLVNRVPSNLSPSQKHGMEPIWSRLLMRSFVKTQPCWVRRALGPVWLCPYEKRPRNTQRRSPGRRRQRRGHTILARGLPIFLPPKKLGYGQECLLPSNLALPTPQV